MNKTDNTALPEKSKSQLKREMIALQKLGEELVALPLAQLQRIPLPDQLRDAILAARSFHSHGALRRQLQFIGKLMRQYDPSAIEQALSVIHNQRAQENAKLHQLEHWRDRLVNEGTAVIEELLAAFPKADRQHLRQLVRNAQKEKLANARPQTARSLLRYLRQLQEKEEG